MSADNVKAQRLLYEALKRIHEECGYENNGEDASEFLVAVMSAESMMLSHLATFGGTIHQLGGINKVVRSWGDIFKKMLREDLRNALAAEQKATRQ